MREKSRVYIIKTSDRTHGVAALMERLGTAAFHSKRVVIKANFNSADPFPASTHPETLGAIIGTLRGETAGITLAERSGMGNTREVMGALGIFDLASRLGFETLVLDQEEREGWVKVEPEGTHWLRGFYISRRFVEAEAVIQTCCLKTHRFGGHFTLSLKNSVGIVARRVPGVHYDYMAELHTSINQRLMIAEVNAHYNVDAVIMDGIGAFVSGGPERGKFVEPKLMLASDDRVAIDAVGVALLQIYGAAGGGVSGKIFELDQIRRAAEIGVGVDSPSKIELIPLEGESEGDALKVMQKLGQ